MKKIFLIFFVLIGQNFLYGVVIKQQVQFAPNNISTWIWNTGVFNQDLRTNNTPGFSWGPREAPGVTQPRFALFTTGLCIGAYYNNSLRLANASFSGEYAPGYVADSIGFKLFKTDSRFRLYSVGRYDTYSNSVDYAEWKNMVPYGAPYEDINNNGYFDALIDKPGVVDAAQTVFVCLTDADPGNHTSSEGFSGGTEPLYAEVCLTAWGYSFGPLADMQYFKWRIINKSDSAWKKTYFTIVTDHDIGDADDDYSGCDTLLQLAYGYNADNQDGTGTARSYGANPPAAGQTLIRSATIKNSEVSDTLKMTSSVYFTNTGSPGPGCEQDPSSSVLLPYNFMRGFKRDGTPWLIPYTSPLRSSKYCYSGNPETNEGWTCLSGRIENCGGATTGQVFSVPGNNGRFILSSGSDNFTVNPGDTQRIVMSQMIAKGSNNLNAVTKLKELAALSRKYYYQAVDEREFPYVAPLKILPDSYKLYQNYPNPFNPVTTIRYEMKKLWNVKIQVYDMRGELIKTLVNEEKPQGSYEIKFDASGLPSGIYFIKMISGGGFEDSKKMVVLK